MEHLRGGAWLIVALIVGSVSLAVLYIRADDGSMRDVETPPEAARGDARDSEEAGVEGRSRGEGTQSADAATSGRAGSPNGGTQVDTEGDAAAAADHDPRGRGGDAADNAAGDSDIPGVEVQADGTLDTQRVNIEVDEVPTWLGRLARPDESHPLTRQAALQGLVPHIIAGPHTDRLVEQVLETARHDPSPDVRRSALDHALHYVGDRGLRVVLDAAREDPDVRVRRSCLHDLKQLADEDYWRVHFMSLSSRYKRGFRAQPPPTGEKRRQVRLSRVIRALQVVDARVASAPTQGERDRARETARILAREWERLQHEENGDDD